MLLIHFVRGAFRRWISGCAIILCATSLWAQWSQQQILSLPPGDGAADDRFGNRVAVDGNVAVVGIYRDDIGANADQGSAIIYRYNGSLWVEEARLTASDGLAGDEFGFWVSIKGSVAVIGALWDDIGANVDQGSAYVFRYNGTTWVQEQKLTAADGAAGDIFGNCLSVSGNAIAVGAPYSDPSFTDQGAVYVFRYNGTSWVQEQKLVASDGASGDAFGNSVSIDNGVIVAGANGDNNGAVLDQGSSYVFRFNGSSWVQEQKLTASDGAANDWFGWSVSINANAVIIGSIYDDIGGNTDQGSAYVFRYNGSSWSQEQKVTASDGLAADHFGRSVGLDGPLAIIGADQDDIGLNVDQGSGYVFRYNGSSWLQEQKVTSSDGAANDLFGHPVAISGNVILAGALFHDITSNPDQGSAYVFRYNGSTWIQEQELSLPGDLGSANDNFAIRSQVNGNVAIVGAYHDDIGLNSDQGSAYIYRLTGGTWIREAKLIASDGQAGDQFGYWVSIEGNVAVVGAVWDDIGANTNQGSAYVFRYNGTSWIQEQKLTASDGNANDLFSNAVCVSGNRIAIGSPYSDVGSVDQGAVYVFRYNGSTWTQEQKLTASDYASGDAFGNSVWIDGSVVIGGANGANNGLTLDQGAAYIFRYNGAAWTEEQKLMAADGAGSDWFGWTVSLSENAAIIGSVYDDNGANSNQGSAYIFRYNGTSWAQEQKLMSSDGAAGDQFGWSVSIKGPVAVAGANLADIGVTGDQGAAYVFRYNGTNWAQEQKLVSSDGAANDWFGFSVSLSPATILAGALFHDILANVDQGAGYVFTTPNGVVNWEGYD